MVAPSPIQIWSCRESDWVEGEGTDQGVVGGVGEEEDSGGRDGGARRWRCRRAVD
jgi:hypothetical protein